MNEIIQNCFIICFIVISFTALYSNHKGKYIMYIINYCAFLLLNGIYVVLVANDNFHNLEFYCMEGEPKIRIISYPLALFIGLSFIIMNYTIIHMLLNIHKSNVQKQENTKIK